MLHRRSVPFVDFGHLLGGKRKQNGRADKRCLLAAKQYARGDVSRPLSGSTANKRGKSHRHFRLLRIEWKWTNLDFFLVFIVLFYARCHCYEFASGSDIYKRKIYGSAAIIIWGEQCWTLSHQLLRPRTMSNSDTYTYLTILYIVVPVVSNDYRTFAKCGYVWLVLAISLSNHSVSFRILAR